MPLRAVLYSRVSTDRQERDGVSLDNQEAMARRHCEAQGWTLTATYTDVKSGRVDKRPQFKQLQADAKARAFDVVIVYRTDRLARGTIKTLQVAELLLSHNVRLVSLTQDLDLLTSQGKLLFRLQAALGEFESDTTSERVRDAMHYTASQGKFTGQQRPLGYAWDKEAGHYQVVEAEAETVKACFVAYLAERSLRGACQVLNAAGHRTRTGRLFATDGLREILRNRAYLGHTVWGRHQGVRNSDGGKRKKALPPEAWAVKENTHPPLIDKATWEAANTLLESRQGKPPRLLYGQAHYAWSGMIRCGLCGGPLTRRTTRTRRKKDGQWSLAHGYLCKTYVSAGRAACPGHVYCSDAYLTQHAIPKLGDVLAETLEEAKRLAGKVRPIRSAPSAPARRVADLEAKRVRILENYEDGHLTRARRDARLAEVDAELSRLATQAPPVAAPVLPLPEIPDLPALWAKFTEAERGELLRLFVERCEATDTHFTFHFRPGSPLPPTLTLDRVDMRGRGSRR